VKNSHVASSYWAVPVRVDPEQASSDLSGDRGARSKLTHLGK
jgi:hypothetical protein